MNIISKFQDQSKKAHYNNKANRSRKKFDIVLRTTVPFVTAHPEIFYCTHHPVIPDSDLYFSFCSIFNALSKRASK